MSAASILRRRVTCAVLLLAVLASAGGLHHHEDLAGAFQAGVPGAATDRVVSNHSPLEKTGAHWHTGVYVKDDPCLACHGQRMAGLPADPCVETPLSLVRFAATSLSFAPASIATVSNGSRAPPALL